MNTFLQRLHALEKPKEIGIVGIGSIGKGMALQADLTPGLHCAAIADIRLERAVAWAEYMGRPYDIVTSQAALDTAVARGRLAVTDDGCLVAGCERLDVFVEATSDVVAGAYHALQAMSRGVDVVMMNYEADLLYGPHLLSVADAADVVYTVCDGDQPTVIRHLVDEMAFMGFDLVMAGNIKGYLDRYADPTSIIPEADKRNLDYKMCASYTDGSKLGVEMAVLANGIGLRTAVPGMVGPRLDSIYDVFDHFDFDALWQGGPGLVDYVLGATPKGGVFAIGHTDHPYQQETLNWFPPQMGPGPYYLFYRPYHLGHLESMRSVVSVALDRQPVLQPRHGFRTNVYAYAKHDLAAGTMLDGMGGYAAYGLIENCADDARDPGIPICLAEQVRLKRPVARDEKIRLADVALDPRPEAFRLFQLALDDSARLQAQPVY